MTLMENMIQMQSNFKLAISNGIVYSICRIIEFSCFKFYLLIAMWLIVQTLHSQVCNENITMGKLLSNGISGNIIQNYDTNIVNDKFGEEIIEKPQDTSIDISILEMLSLSKIVKIEHNKKYISMQGKEEVWLYINSKKIYISNDFLYNFLKTLKPDNFNYIHIKSQESNNVPVYVGIISLR